MVNTSRNCEVAKARLRGWLSLDRSLCYANGAMGLAYELFDYRSWFVYVVVTVVFEAWWIGRWMPHPWTLSVLYSLLANGLTALLGLSCFVPFLHASLWGPPENPNPLGNAVAIFVGMGLVSAVFESYVWRLSDRKAPGFKVFIRSLSAHAIGVILAFVIFLVPSRPYKGLEIRTDRQRRILWILSKRPLNAWVGDHDNRLPSQEQIHQIIDGSGPLAWTVWYQPEFGRFDIGESRQHPFKIEWNPSYTKIDLEKHNGDTWVCRLFNDDGSEKAGLILRDSQFDVTHKW
jgi:hypothetical protein